MTLSIVIPAKNEALSIRNLLAEIKLLHPQAEILVIDDGSTDHTAQEAQEYANVIKHPYSMGNGAAIKTGVRQAKGETIVCMDADGQHKPKDIRHLLLKMNEGYDMVVAARNRTSQASITRAFGNSFYNIFASWMTEQKIQDLTSGFRAVRASKFREFLYLLPNGFSYPTTITMAFFRAGYGVGYTPIEANKRQGKSHIKLSKDGMRFLMIIFKIGTLYSPLKIFLPFSLFFFLTGTFYYSYTYFAHSRFTNMSALLLSISVVIFLIGLVSEQITNLMYNKENGN